MKLKLMPAVIASLSLFATPFVLAKDFRSQIDVDYVETDWDESSIDIYGVGVTGTFYFSTIGTANKPLAESAFLQKSSNVYVSGFYDEVEEKIDNHSGKSRVYGRELGAELYVPNSIFYAGAGVYERKYKATWKTNGASGSFSEDWDTQWYVKAGITPVDGLLVWSEFYEDVDVSEAWNINAKYVLPLGDESQWINLEANFEDYDAGNGGHVLSLAGDYYFDHQLSVGAGINHYNDDDDIDGIENTYFVRANQFFTDHISLNLTYTFAEDDNRWLIGASVRF